MPAIPPVKYRFKKGQSGNPLGGQMHDKIKKEFKHLTEQQLKEVMELILLTRPDKIKEEIEKKPTVLKTWLASAASKGISRGDIGPLMQIVDRVIGKVKERIEITNGLSDEDLQKEIERLRAIAAPTA